jgi:hypothetical protein
MHRVYRNSYLNLAAGASPNSTGGLVYPRSLSSLPCRIALGSGAQERLVVSLYISECSMNNVLILSTRSWVVQEKLLATCPPVFEQDKVSWDCAELEPGENIPHLIQGVDIRAKPEQLGF